MDLAKTDEISLRALQEKLASFTSGEELFWIIVSLCPTRLTLTECIQLRRVLKSTENETYKHGVQTGTQRAQTAQDATRKVTTMVKPPISLGSIICTAFDRLFDFPYFVGIILLAVYQISKRLR